MDVIIRKTDGFPFNLDDLSIVQLYEEHLKAEERTGVDPVSFL